MAPRRIPSALRVDNARIRAGGARCVSVAATSRAVTRWRSRHGHQPQATRRTR